MFLSRIYNLWSVLRGLFTQPLRKPLGNPCEPRFDGA